MNFTNDDDLYDFIEQVTELQERAADIATTILNLQGTRGTIEPEDIRFDGNSIYARYEEYHCGEVDYHDIYVPFEYLLDDDYIDDAKEQLRLRKEKEERDKQERLERERRLAETRERSEYLRLKEKFG